MEKHLRYPLTIYSLSRRKSGKSASSQCIVFDTRPRKSTLSPRTFLASGSRCRKGVRSSMSCRTRGRRQAFQGDGQVFPKNATRDLPWLTVRDSGSRCPLIDALRRANGCMMAFSDCVNQRSNLSLRFRSQPAYVVDAQTLSGIMRSSWPIRPPSCARTHPRRIDSASRIQ